MAPLLTLRADSQQLKDIRENPLVEEVTPAPETETLGAYPWALNGAWKGDV